MEDSLKEKTELEARERKQFELYLEIKEKTKNASQKFIQGDINMLNIGLIIIILKMEK